MTFFEQKLKSKRVPFSSQLDETDDSQRAGK